MHVVSKKKLRDFWLLERSAEGPLREWYKNVCRFRWTKFADVRHSYASADKVGRCIVFNLGGNKYRVIAEMSRNWRRIYVRYVLSHKDYDRATWKASCW
jgi:mRNA interferase HigB